MKIAVISGDGIGSEIIAQGKKVLRTVAHKYNFDFEYEDVLLGGSAFDKKGTPLPEETVEICKNSEAVLLGAVGGPKWDNLPGNLRPESGLLGMRKALGVFANLRPAILFPELVGSSNLKPEVLGRGLDIMIVRELIGGAYFGEKGTVNIKGGQKAWDTIAYTSFEIDRIARKSFEIARKRNKRLTLVDKANVLESSKLWRKTVRKISDEYKDVEVSYMYVDNAAMQLIRDPKQFDVILTENMFGDILSDEASMLTGSLGMLPSASVRGDSFGLYEPVHGSAPDIAGQNKANPIGTIMSIAMMLKYSFNMTTAAEDIKNAVSQVLGGGYRTVDIAEKDTEVIGTEEMGELICKYM
ncbi:3-isopropylmalate dehydrogenase [Clostridium sp. MT-14]|uniref:3-isopropylmalate dehydrogenase n=1 Tax=Clostridium aromativorans TaxID=2836848 RepID=A0ABS8N217_9CLOT|nr:3-isopropylmalate dehydrogenase [Clostridium aromativorans]MCC9293854.1 3-isopropylmalate dehydrogenase [Clostridium aromativorans]CAB1241367.1 3-isopropylmalate dehydrogenase [Clostridiaceae bacterium BL-3]